MGIMDKVKSMLGQHGDKVGQGLDKAAEAVDSKTGGKYSGQIKSGTQKAKDAVGAPADDADGKDKKSSEGGESTDTKSAKDDSGKPDSSDDRDGRGKGTSL